MALVPYVVEQTNRGERSYDIYSRLLNDRIVMLNEEVNSASASVVVPRSSARTAFSVFTSTAPAAV